MKSEKVTGIVIVSVGGISTCTVHDVPMIYFSSVQCRGLFKESNLVGHMANYIVLANLKYQL